MRRLLLPVLASLVFALSAAGADDAPVRVTLKDTKGQPVADAVVVLVPLDRAISPAAEPVPTVQVAQEDEQYHPLLTIVRTGTRVVFPNKDRIQHHLYSVSPAKRFEKPLYAPGAEEAVVFDRPGVITLGCNIHDWMVAYIVVVDTPWFTRTDAAGRAELAAPAGRYRLELWHPRLVDPRTRRVRTAPQQQEVEVAAAGLGLELEVPLAPDRRIRRAPSGKSGRY